jgi:hypothetical protein
VGICYKEQYILPTIQYSSSYAKSNNSDQSVIPVRELESRGQDVRGKFLGWARLARKRMAAGFCAVYRSPAAA